MKFPVYISPNNSHILVTNSQISFGMDKSLDKKYSDFYQYNQSTQYPEGFSRTVTVVEHFHRTSKMENQKCKVIEENLILKLEHWK